MLITLDSNDESLRDDPCFLFICVWIFLIIIGKSDIPDVCDLENKYVHRVILCRLASPRIRYEPQMLGNHLSFRYTFLHLLGTLVCLFTILAIKKFSLKSFSVGNWKKNWGAWLFCCLLTLKGAWRRYLIFTFSWFKFPFCNGWLDRLLTRVV